jgi:hypothetical protein
VTKVKRTLKNRKAIAVSLTLLAAQMLNSSDAVAGPSSKLIYLLSESRKVIVYVASSGTSESPTVDVAIELIDSKISQKIDLFERSGVSTDDGTLSGLSRKTFNSPLELPKADLIEGVIPAGVTEESKADLSRNLFKEAMFVFRVPYSKSNLAVVYPVDQIFETGKVLAFKVFEPKSSVDNFRRHFSFALAQGAPVLGYEPYSLVTSIADIRDGKALGYGTLAVDVGSSMYHVSGDWLNLANLGTGLKVIRRSVHTSVFDLVYKNDKIAQMSAGGMRSWPNGIDPKEIKDLSYESAPRYRELQTQRIVSRIDSTESSVQATTEFTNVLLANAEIASKLKRLDAAVLHSEIKTISTVGSSYFYVLLKVSSVANSSRKTSLTESFWVIKLNHYTQEILGTQKLSSLAAARLETIFPGDLMLTARGKMEKLIFQTPTGTMLCRQLFNSAP